MADEPRDDDRQPRNPLEDLMRQLGLGGDGANLDLNQVMGALQAQFSQFSSQFGAFMAPSADGKVVNWEQTRTTARHVVAAMGPDPSMTPADLQAVREAVDLADIWLDGVTRFAPVPTCKALSRAEWVEASMPTWQRLVEPIASHLADAMQEVAGGNLAEHPELAQFQSMMAPMVRRSAGAMLAGTAGTSIGKLAAEATTATDVGLPVVTGSMALLPTNIAAFADGLDLPLRDVRIYLAVREAARQRLFASVGWLGTQLLALVEHYAREITIDQAALEEAMGPMSASLDGGLDPAALQEAAERVNGALFSPATTPEQQDVLGRLEVLLALVEGWVDDVTAQATATILPAAGQLAEMVRRRRAAGGATTAALKDLLGVELQPRRVREAATLWAALRDARGNDGRDEVWLHPDLLPTAADLSDPLGYVNGETREAEAGDDGLDAELRALLEAEPGPDADA